MRTDRRRKSYGPRMSTNAPPTAFYVGVMLLPVVLMSCVLFLAAPLNWVIGVGASLLVVLFTRWGTRIQVRKESDEAVEADDHLRE